MRILIVGSNSDYAIERFYLKYLNEFADTQAQLFEAQTLFLSYYYRSIINKLLFRLGYKNIYLTINKQLRSKILDFRPDILFVFKGMEVLPKTIQWAQEQRIKVVNYNPDNPFIFSGKGSGNSNVTRSVSVYDLHFTYNLQVKKIIEQEYQIPVNWLPFGFDITETLYQSASLEPEVIKTCFVGNPDKQRASFLRTLAEHKIKIDVYGDKWNKFINHPNIAIYPWVNGDNLWITLRKYRVQLNPLRIHNLNSHCMRSFEVPGIGGIMLAPRTCEHIQFFEEGEEAFYYKDIEEALLKVNYLLSLTQLEANEIRDAARKRSLQSGYSYKDRTAQVINILTSIEA